MTAVTCHELIDFLSDYIDGQLPRETVTAFESHLNICPNCVAYVTNFRTTLAATKAAHAPSSVSPPLPEELVQAILSSTRTTKG